MQSLESLGFAEYYFLDNEKIYNAKSKIYLKENREFSYKLLDKNGKIKSITLKKIYRELFDKVFCKDEIELLENESFKEIEGTLGNYEVSNLGRIKSKIGNHAIIMKGYISKSGYERLQIYMDGKRYTKLVHVLVAAAWLGNPPSLEYDIHQKDFNCLNNAATNLEYLSKQEHYKKHEERKKK